MCLDQKPFYTVLSPKLFFYFWTDSQIDAIVSAFYSPTTIATTLHLCAPFIHIAQSLNLIIIMLNQESSCVKS